MPQYEDGNDCVFPYNPNPRPYRPKPWRPMEPRWPRDWPRDDFPVPLPPPRRETPKAYKTIAKEPLHYRTVKTEQFFTLSVLVPGATDKDVTTEIVDNTIKVTANYTTTDNVWTIIRNLTVEVPKDFDIDCTKAVLELGVLTIDIPRKSPRKSRKVVINH